MYGVVWTAKCLAGTAALALIVIAVAVRGAHQRALAISEFARAQGFRRSPNPTAFINTVRVFELFRRGESRSLRNLLRRDGEGVSVFLCDYRYQGYLDGPLSKSQTLCLMRSQALDLPHFLLRRRAMLVRFLGQPWPRRALDFREDPRFSKAFVLFGREEEVKPTLSSRVRAQLTPLAVKGFELEAWHDTVIFHVSRRLRVELLPQFIADARAVLDALSAQ